MSAETSTNNNRHNPKKYPNTPKSPLMNNANVGGNRSQTARNRLLSSKISAPRPINLPSLKREHEGTEQPIPTASPATGWRSNTNSPSLPHSHSPEQKPAESISQSENTTRAWAMTDANKHDIDKPEDPKPDDMNDKKRNPSLSDDKEYLKYASSDPNHTSWDEMVSEDLGEFSVDVIEFDDGTKVQIDTTTTTAEEPPVSPSDRFTEDYDRSYHRSHHPPPPPPPPQQQQQQQQQQHHYDHYKPFYHNTQRRSEEHYRYDNNRRSSAPWPRRDSFEHRTRRPSYENRSPPPPMQRSRRLSEHSARSDHSKEEPTNSLQIIPEPEEITVAQKNLMLTAAERAKKRRDEQEAEYAAAAERARQKAAALAALVEPLKKKKEEEEEEEKPIKILQKKQEPVITTDKPWNMVVVGSKQTSQMPTELPTKQPTEPTKDGSLEHMVTITTVDMTEPEKPALPRKPSTEDETKWAAYVSGVRKDSKSSNTTMTSSNDWSLYANRLAAEDKSKTGSQTEYMDYQAEWDITRPSHPSHRAPWTLEDVQQRRSKSDTRNPYGEPGTVSILKPNRSGKTKPSVLLREATAPLFPVFMEHIVGKKPANMSFMVDTDESDKDITMMHCAMMTTSYSPYYPVLVYHGPQPSNEAVYLMPPKQHEPLLARSNHSDHFPSFTAIHNRTKHSYRKKKREPKQ